MSTSHIWKLNVIERLDHAFIKYFKDLGSEKKKPGLSNNHEWSDKVNQLTMNKIISHLNPLYQPIKLCTTILFTSPPGHHYCTLKKHSFLPNSATGRGSGSQTMCFFVPPQAAESI